VNYGFEQSVGTFVDGVYFGRGRSARGKFLDLERVEVLKGPQSTLFGKNTIAGAINITTGQPTEEFEGYISAGYTSELEAKTVTGVVSGPLSDSVRGRVAVRSYEDKGYVSNLTESGVDGPQNDSVYVRGTLAIDLSEDWTATIKAEHGTHDVKGRQEIITQANPLATSLYSGASGADNFEAGLGYNNYQQNIADLPLFDDTESSIMQVTLDGAIGEHGVKAVIAYADYEFTNSLDTDYGPLRLINRARNEEHEQMSAEFILSSPTDGNFEYTAGAYYQTEELSHDRYSHVAPSGAPALQGGIMNSLNTTMVAPGVSFAQAFLSGNLNPMTDNGALDGTALNSLDQDADSWSVFFDGTYNISDTLRITAGLRYSEDDKKMSKSAAICHLDPTAALFDFSDDKTCVDDNGLRLSTDELGDAFARGLKLAKTHAYTRERSEDHVTGHVNLQWDMSDETMVYLEVGNGYKAGGFDEDNGLGRELETVNGVTDDLADFEDETVETIEIGAKINLADGRGRLNIAAFSSTYEDVQVSTFDGTAGFVVGNAAESEVQGIEADVLYRATEEITINGAFAYMDATYKSYPGAGCNVAQVIDNGGPTGCTQDLTGKQLQFAPEYTANVGISYATELSSGLLLNAALDYNWTDDVIIAADMDENLIQDSYGKLNARISLASGDQWQLSLIGKNLTSKDTFMWGNDIPLGSLGFNNSFFKMIDPPRTVELVARMNF
jgi:outer membrane receptor protein involved in Fe transport